MIQKKTPGSHWVRDLRVHFLIVSFSFLSWSLVLSLSLFFHTISYLILPGSLKGAADEAIKKFEKENVPTKTPEKVAKLKTYVQLF